MSSTTYHEFPILYGLEKNGKVRLWKAIVSTQHDTAIATITYGQVDGKQQETIRDYTTGKNIGKANETTPYQQCFSETERKWKDKKDKEGYTIEQPDGTSRNKDLVDEKPICNHDGKVFPMLAGTYVVDAKKRNDIVYPCLVQPKLDGLRCIMYMRDGKVLAQSRAGSYFETLSYLTEACRDLFIHHPELVLDGELYTSDIPFETLAGLIKKKKVTDADKEMLQRHVKYHVYDLVSTDPFTVRHEQLQHLTWNPYMVPVQTILVQNVAECKGYFSQFVEGGFEGIMLRNTNGLYRQGFRSHDLQKYKEFCEEEYQIKGYEEGEGRDKGCVIWVCQTPDGKPFRVRPRGTMEQRREWFSNGSDYIDKMLTVIFQELSEQQVPRFPVGKAIRDGY